LRRLIAIAVVTGFLALPVISANAAPISPAQPAATWTGTKCNGHPNISYWRVCLTITGSGQVLQTAHIAAGYRPTSGFFGWNFTGFGAVYANPLNSFKPAIGPTVHQTGHGITSTGHYNWTARLNKRLKAGERICATLYQIIGSKAYPRQTVCF
jgi:hypothetical protein